MCLVNESNNRKARILLTIGLLCLVIALASQSMSLTFGLPHGPLQFLRGFFVGASIVLNLYSTRILARQRRSTPPSLS